MSIFKNVKVSTGRTVRCVACDKFIDTLYCNETMYVVSIVVMCVTCNFNKKRFGGGNG